MTDVDRRSADVDVDADVDRPRVLGIHCNSIDILSLKPGLHIAVMVVSKHVSDSVPSSFDIREHFDYNTDLHCNQLFSFFQLQ